MARPKGGYKLDGEKIPGCTTIAGFGEDKSALIGWANKIGREHGVTTHEFLRTAQDAGTLAHEMIESWLREQHGMEPLTPSQGHSKDIVEYATVALDGFKRWAEDRQLKILGLEESLVSKVHLFGGTSDLRCTTFGKYHTLIDFKTSNTGPYASWVIQMAGYRILQHENHPDNPPIERVANLKISKLDATFIDCDWAAGLVADAEKAFVALRAAYGARKALEQKGRI